MILKHTCEKTKGFIYPGSEYRGKETKRESLQIGMWRYAIYPIPDRVHWVETEIQAKVACDKLVTYL